ncbi:hypothetical protein BGZ76_009112 [Entomortierella beljakovae]|nr:hypothetical protein BGZ76_009112 [Entomortierella beljakovae]
MHDVFDYSDSKEYQVAYDELPSIKAKLSHGRSLLELQETFLSVAISRSSILGAIDETTADATQEGYEVARILDPLR